MRRFCNVPPLRCVNAFGIFSINGVAYETKCNSQDKIASPQKWTSPVALNRSFASLYHIGVLNCQISVARDWEIHKWNLHNLLRNSKQKMSCLTGELKNCGSFVSRWSSPAEARAEHTCCCCCCFLVLLLFKIDRRRHSPPKRKRDVLRNLQQTPVGRRATRARNGVVSGEALGLHKRLLVAIATAMAANNAHWLKPCPSTSPSPILIFKNFPTNECGGNG
jgi:hypothetical protein